MILPVTLGERPNEVEEPNCFGIHPIMFTKWPRSGGGWSKFEETSETTSPLMTGDGDGDLHPGELKLVELDLKN
jgi:hypothetical protein